MQNKFRSFLKSIFFQIFYNQTFHKKKVQLSKSMHHVCFFSNYLKKITEMIIIIMFVLHINIINGNSFIEIWCQEDSLQLLNFSENPHRINDDV